MAAVIEEKVRDFLQKHFIPNQPILLGYSGGPDSKALLAVLLFLRKEFLFDLHIAHINHGWRKESDDEAQEIQEEAKNNSVACHYKKLEWTTTKNQESEARNYRIQFFQELMQKFPFQALMLAHQADDVAETVIKRLFEGAHLPLSGGMEEVSCREGMKIWRPLLSVSKKSILQWLEKKSLSFFYDKTNADKKFLRARMREEMIPYLSKSFGKEISENLYYTSLRLHELKEFLDSRVQEAFLTRQKGPLGVYLNWNPYLSFHRIENRHLLKKLLQEEGVDLSREQIELVLDKIGSSDSLEGDFSLPVKEKMVIVDRGRFFITKKLFLEKSFFVLFEGSTVWQNWKISVEKFTLSEGSMKEIISGWKNLWKGPVSIVVAKGKDDMKLSFAKEGAHYLGRRLCRFWSYHEVPGFLRFSVPVVYKNEEILGEVLSGRNFFLKKEQEEFWKVTLEIS